MKKTLLLAALLNICLLNVRAQTESEEPDHFLRFKGQLGFDATGFLKQFVVLNNNATPVTNPFAYNAKFLIGFNPYPKLSIGPRIGFGYVTSHEYSNNENQSNERSDDSKDRSTRIGLELQQLVSKRWTVYYGFDYINNVSSSSTVTTSMVFNPNPPFGTTNARTESITSNKSFGYGPILGIQFNINKWMCLGTETAFYSVQSKGGTKVTSTNPNNTTPETFTDAKNTQMILPFFINFNIVF
jgi:opacity protein-like surface antigen